jgi:hypothetical protein
MVPLYVCAVVNTDGTIDTVADTGVEPLAGDTESHAGVLDALIVTATEPPTLVTLSV